jgi:hypothetical protein
MCSALTLLSSEFGNVIIYALIYAILIVRIRSGYYNPEQSKHVRSVANLMVVYPLVYVICTIPLASSRMSAMSGNPPSLVRLCLSGAIITSNGWLDVLLYAYTRRILIFNDEPPSDDDNGVDTFAVFWVEKTTRFGGECTVEATNMQSKSRRGRSKGKITLSSRSDSSDDLVSAGATDIKLITTTQVTSELAQPEDVEEMEAGARKSRPRTPNSRWSTESSDSRNLSLKDLSIPHIVN